MNSGGETGGSRGDESITQDSGFLDRLKAIRTHLGKSQQAMGQTLGVSKNAWQLYESGTNAPGSQVISALARLGIDVHWLLTGEGGMSRADHQQPNSGSTDMVREKSGEYALVPLYDVRAAAGYGAELAGEQVMDALAFSRRWIHRELHASPADLYLIYVDGESMEPTLRAGDIILVDRRDGAAIPCDGIYVLRMDGALLVKRLQRLPGRRIRVVSDNPAYAPIELSLNSPGEDLAVIGRVVWSGHRL